MNIKDFRKKTSIFLGLLGIINSMLLSLYIFLTIQTLPLVSTEFLNQGYLGSGIAAICACLPMSGIYLVWKGRFYTGGIINLASGLTLFCIFIYFAYLIEIQVLKWVEPIGFFLAIPQILSGLIAVTSKTDS